MDERQKTIARMKEEQSAAQHKTTLRDSIIDKKMASTLFPAKLLTPRWYELTRKALMGSAPIMHQTPLVEFAKAVKTVADNSAGVNLSQFKARCNSLDCISPVSLGLSDEEYHDFIMEVHAMVDEWRKMIEAINAEAEKEVEMILLGNGVGTNILKPIKGEA